MRKFHSQGLAFKGEITALSALVFALIVSLVGALLQSALLHGERAVERSKVRCALESVFAEYHKGMLEEYEIFARPGSEEVLRERLSYYGAGEAAQSFVKEEYLTDHGGLPFYLQAVRYMTDWYGMEGAQDILELEEEHIEEEEQKILDRIKEVLEEANLTISEEDNPIAYIQSLKKNALLPVLISDEQEISNRSLKLEQLPTHRDLQKGNTTRTTTHGIKEWALFQGYVAEHFKNYQKQDETRSLLYEQEYLLCGKGEDRENLELVCRKMVSLRLVTNAAYLMSNQSRQAEAEELAALLCAALMVPELIDLMKVALLFAWAYGESIVDVRVLLKGKKVPLVKNDFNWQLQLSSLHNLGSAAEDVQEKEDENGISYSMYLAGLLATKKRETICMRCLDLMEANLNQKVDQCFTGVEVKTKSYGTFYTTFLYQ